MEPLVRLGTEIATLLRREAAMRVELEGVDKRIREITAELTDLTSALRDVPVDPDSTAVIEMPFRMRRTETPIADAVITSGEIPRIVPCPDGCTASGVFAHEHGPDGRFRYVAADQS